VLDTTEFTELDDTGSALGVGTEELDAITSEEADDGAAGASPTGQSPPVKRPNSIRKLSLVSLVVVRSSVPWSHWIRSPKLLTKVYCRHPVYTLPRNPPVHFNSC
jgi:hypothetical protein